MIKSLSRLVRQVFVGARAHPTSEAIMGADGRPTNDAAMRHEDLKRAMEIAFAAPASPLEPATGVVVEMAIGHEAVAEIVPETSRMEEEAIASVDETNSSWDDAVEPVEEAVAVAEETVEEVAEEQLEEVLADAETESVSEAADELVAVEAEADLDTPPVGVVEEEDASVEEHVADAIAEETAVAPSDELVGEDVVTDEVAAEDVVNEAAAATGDTAVEDALAAAPAKRTRAKKAAAKKKKAAPRKKSASKKAAAPKAAAELPEDEVWISDAVGYTLSGAWSSAWSPPEDSAGVERLEEFRAKAAEGALAIWGRVEGADEWVPIKASYWKSAVVEPLSFLMGRENVATEAKNAKSKAKAYSALKVSKARVEELWPVAAGEEVRDAA